MSSDRGHYHTPAPWPESLAPPIYKGDARVLLNGKPPLADCRILSEGNYRFALQRVNTNQPERDRIRTELIDWLIGDLSPADAGLINGRRIVDEIDRICPKE